MKKNNKNNMLACISALEISSSIEKDQTNLSTDEQFHIGISISAGSVYITERGIIGDAANFNHRLAGANRPYGTKILIDEKSFLPVRNKFINRIIDRMTLKGNGAIDVYELVDKK